MLLRILYSFALVFATVLIHAGCTAAVLGWLRSVEAHHWVLRTYVRRSALLAVIVLLMTLAAVLESGLWASLYLAVDALSTTEEALYFSLVTFTTLGYGDITLPEHWRILGAFQAANGAIMFGWTTALSRPSPRGCG